MQRNALEELHLQIAEEELQQVHELCATLSAQQLDTLHQGNTALMLAANATDRLNAYAMSCTLLMQGASAGHSSNGISPLVIAAQRNDAPLCQLLISHGAKVLGSENAYSPLQLRVAATDSVTNVECFRFLVDEALKCVTKDVTRTQVLALALQKACSLGNLRMAQMLLTEYAADPNARAGTLNNEDSEVSPLMVLSDSISKDQIELELITDLLIKHGADPEVSSLENLTVLENAVSRGKIGMVKSFIKHGFYVDDHPSMRACNLARAAYSNMPEMLQLLIDNGAEINFFDRTKKGVAPLGEAVLYGRSCVLPLLCAGENPNTVCTRWSRTTSVLHFATAVNDSDVVADLLRFGGDPNVKDRDGLTPLHLSVVDRSFRIFSLLLEYGALGHLANPKVQASPHLDIDEWPLKPSSRKKGLLHEDIKNVFARNLRNGLLWPRWTKQTHQHFPTVVRHAIVTTLLCSKRNESPLSWLPRDVLFLLFEFVATSSRDSLWRRCSAARNEPWVLSSSFLDLTLMRNCAHLVPDGVRDVVRDGVCTKEVFKAERIMQHAYLCFTCASYSSRTYIVHKFPKLPIICETCALSCHKGHSVVLANFTSFACHCAGSQGCKKATQLSTLLSCSDWSKQTFLVCTKNFEAAIDGSIAPVTVGEVLRVNVTSLADGRLVGNWLGFRTAFPANAAFVRRIDDFVVMLCDHEAADSAASSDRRSTFEAHELSYKKGDLVFVLGKLRGKLADGKFAPIRGVLCTGGKPISGWFDAFHAETIQNYNENRAAAKVALAKACTEFLRRVDGVGTRVEALRLANEIMRLQGTVVGGGPTFGPIRSALLPVFGQIARMAEAAYEFELAVSVRTVIENLSQHANHEYRSRNLSWLINLCFCCNRVDELKKAAGVLIEIAEGNDRDGYVLFAKLVVAIVEQRWQDCKQLVEGSTFPLAKGASVESSLYLKLNRFVLMTLLVVDPQKLSCDLFFDSIEAIQLFAISVLVRQLKARYLGVHEVFATMDVFVMFLYNNPLALGSADVSFEAMLLASAIGVFAWRKEIHPVFEFYAVKCELVSLLDRLALILFRCGELKKCAAVARLAWLIVAGVSKGEDVLGTEIALASAGRTDAVTFKFVSFESLESVGSCEPAVFEFSDRASCPSDGVLSARGPLLLVGLSQEGQAVFFSTCAGIDRNFLSSLRGPAALMRRGEWTPEVFPVSTADETNTLLAGFSEFNLAQRKGEEAFSVSLVSDAARQRADAIRLCTRDSQVPATTLTRETSSSSSSTASTFSHLVGAVAGVAIGAICAYMIMSRKHA